MQERENQKKIKNSIKTHTKSISIVKVKSELKRILIKYCSGGKVSHHEII